jgi:hypothetical protein
MSLIATSVATTPRRSLRFLNVYRVIKAGLDGAAIDKLENRAGYRALMVQLAIATSSPNLLKPWLKLLDEREPHCGMIELIKLLEARPWFVESETGPMVKGALDAFSASPIKKKDGEEDAHAVHAMLAEVLKNSTITELGRDATALEASQGLSRAATAIFRVFSTGNCRLPEFSKPDRLRRVR